MAVSSPFWGLNPRALAGRAAAPMLRRPWHRLELPLLLRSSWTTVSKGEDTACLLLAAYLADGPSLEPPQGYCGLVLGCAQGHAHAPKRSTCAAPALDRAHRRRLHSRLRVEGAPFQRQFVEGDGWESAALAEPPT